MPLKNRTIFQNGQYQIKYYHDLIFIYSSFLIVFDDEECKVDDWDEPLGLVPGQDKSWGLFSNPTVINI